MTRKLKPSEDPEDIKDPVFKEKYLAYIEAPQE
jgi:hypothetical protein